MKEWRRLFAAGPHGLAITGGNPSLLSKEDPEKVGRANRAVSKAYRPAIELITRHDINWTIVASATPAWAAAVFPDLPPDQAMTKLWDAIFAASRVDVDDPIARWKQHDSGLHRRADLMNEKRYAALHFRGPGTDLRVGLADDHLWMGGGTKAGTGAYCIPNMPTEEVFTTPHKDRVEGTVTSTKPLSHQGTLIEKIAVRFEGGRVVDAKASRGQEVLQRMIDTDDGARRLGEVALVPHSSPIASSGLLFLNTLFDENAASHIALGQAYSTCLKNGDQLTPEELAARGANESLIHVDWMIGSSEIDLDGITATGSCGTPDAQRRVGVRKRNRRSRGTPGQGSPLRFAAVEMTIRLQLVTALSWRESIRSKQICHLDGAKHRRDPARRAADPRSYPQQLQIKLLQSCPRPQTTTGSSAGRHRCGCDRHEAPRRPES